MVAKERPLACRVSFPQTNILLLSSTTRSICYILKFKAPGGILYSRLFRLLVSRRRGRQRIWVSDMTAKTGNSQSSPKSTESTDYL